jgi:hypothetical protein
MHMPAERITMRTIREVIRLKFECKLTKPLPAVRYQFARWKKARVNMDYHVEVDGHYYSVPYQLIQKELDIKLTSNIVECFYKGKSVASHMVSDRQERHGPEWVAEILRNERPNSTEFEGRSRYKSKRQCHPASNWLKADCRKTKAQPISRNAERLSLKRVVRQCPAFNTALNANRNLKKRRDSCIV